MCAAPWLCVCANLCYHRCRLTRRFAAGRSGARMMQAANTALEDVLFYGNPIYEGLDKQEAKLQVLKRIPFVRKVDGDIVKDTEREEAAAL